MKSTNPLQIGRYINKDGETFDLSWWKWQEPTHYNYRMYFIKAHHSKWMDKVYSVFVIKDRYPNEKDATHLVTSYLLDKIKLRLDLAKDGKHLLVFSPLNNEGWALV